MNIKEESILISVIIPMYNAETYIARCLASIIGQKMSGIEIIVVDDLSMDNSPKIVSHYQQHHKQVKYIKMPSKGFPGGARNLGTLHAVGKYISYIDSDDWIDENMISSLYKVIVKYNADIAVCSVKNEHTNPLKASIRYKYSIEECLTSEESLERLAAPYNQETSISPRVCNKLFKADFLKKNHLSFLENKLNEDDVFSYSALLAKCRLVTVPGTYYHYVQNEESLTHQFTERNIMDLIYAFQMLRSDLQKKNKFDANRETFFPFFNRCIISVVNALHESQLSEGVKQEYLENLEWKLQTNFTEMEMRHILESLNLSYSIVES